MTKKITQLPAASAASGTELAEVVQSGTSVKMTTQAIADLASSGGSDTQVQFNDVGNFGGDPVFTFDKTTKILKRAGDGFFQSGPDTYGASGWSGYNLSIEHYRVAATESLVQEIYVESAVGDIVDSNISGIFLLIGTQAGINATQNIDRVEGITGIAKSVLPSGLTTDVLSGLNFYAFASGGGTVTDGYACFLQVAAAAGSTIETAYGNSIGLFNMSSSNDTSVVYGSYIIYGNFYSYHNAFSYWSGDMNGVATNPYHLWFDSRGVYNIKEDNTFDSVGQAIHALYNPQFTKYTPGAANYERIVQRWNGNVAEVGVEKGGTGTLRALRLLGNGLQYSSFVSPQASTPLSTNANVSGSVFTNEGASAQIEYDLPTAAANLTYTFVVQDSDGIKVVANTGDTIRIAAAVSASAGNIVNNTIGGTVTLVSINATEWVATAVNGTWTVT